LKYKLETRTGDFFKTQIIAQNLEFFLLARANLYLIQGRDDNQPHITLASWAIHSISLGSSFSTKKKGH
jgi:hypothetical protein